MAFRGADVTMIKADLKFIEDSLFDTKNGADTAGSYVMRNEKTVVGYIFRALYTRYNKLPYGFQNSSNAENTPESESVNRAMAEAEQKHGDETTVTAESVEIPVGTPKGGKGSKKDKTAA